MAKQILLTKGYSATVDDEDFEWLNQWKWFAMSLRNGNLLYAGRAVRGEDGKQHTLLMHRFIMNPPAGAEIDHINGNGLDNRRANLRLATTAENLRNRGVFRNSKSGYKGVVYNPANGKWKVTINLGTFDTPEEAARAYDDAITKLFGTLARPNFDDC